MAKEQQKKETKEKSATARKETAQRPRKSGIAKYAAAIILIVVIIFVAIFAGALLTHPQPSGNFDVFVKNYDSAPRVDIFVTAYNGTVLSSTIGCATAVIERIVASQTNHRNASTIDLNIINQTSCIRSKGLGTIGANYTTTSVQNCLNTSSTEPSIYINYSSTNTTIIKPDYLYVSGNELFLRECGLASELG